MFPNYALETAFHLLLKFVGKHVTLGQGKNLLFCEKSLESGFWSWNPELGEPMQPHRSWLFPLGSEHFAKMRWFLPSNLAPGFIFAPSSAHLLQWTCTLTQDSSFSYPFFPPSPPPPTRLSMKADLTCDRSQDKKKHCRRIQATAQEGKTSSKS